LIFRSPLVLITPSYNHTKNLFDRYRVLERRNVSILAHDDGCPYAFAAFVCSDLKRIRFLFLCFVFLLLLLFLSFSRSHIDSQQSTFRPPVVYKSLGEGKHVLRVGQVVPLTVIEAQQPIDTHTLLGQVKGSKHIVQVYFTDIYDGTQACLFASEFTSS
jgi:hypothetical protein